MLKSKKDANYRRAVRLKDGDRVNCEHCALRQFVDVRGIGGAGVVGQGWRCEAVGMQNSRRYTVEAGHVCDHFKAMPEDK